MCREFSKQKTKRVKRGIVFLVLGVVVAFLYLLLVYNPQITSFDRAIALMQHYFGVLDTVPPSRMTGLRLVPRPGKNRTHLVEEYLVNGMTIVAFTQNDSTGDNVAVIVRMGNDSKKPGQKIQNWSRCFSAYFAKQSGDYRYGWLRYRDGIALIGEVAPVLLFGDANGALNAQLNPEVTEDNFVWETDNDFEITIGDVTLTPDKDFW